MIVSNKCGLSTIYASVYFRALFIHTHNIGGSALQELILSKCTCVF